MYQRFLPSVTFCSFCAFSIHDQFTGYTAVQLVINSTMNTAKLHTDLRAQSKVSRRTQCKNKPYLDLLHEQCKVSFTEDATYRVSFLTGTPQFQDQKENRESANHICCSSKTCAVIGCLAAFFLVLKLGGPS